MITLSRKKSLVYAAFLLSIASTDAPVRAQAPTYESAEAVYRTNLTRNSLSRRIEGRRVLAVTSDPRALSTLVDGYKSPEEPEAVVRTLLVTLVADFYEGDTTVEDWQKWREAWPTAENCWLWFRALSKETALGSTAWRDVAMDPRKPLELRATAITAAAAAKQDGLLDDEALGVAMELSATLRPRNNERALLLEALMTMFEGRNDKLTPKQRSVLRSLVHTVAERRTTMRTRVVVARMLARILGRENIGPDPEAWLELIVEETTDEIEVAYAKKRAAARPGFFGIVEHGSTFAYVIDASDSMLAPMTPNELGALHPLTGESAAKDKKEGREVRALQAERAIDWSKVKTRFDGARELLKLALRRLSRDDKFTVILFGDEAEYLQATPRLVAAAKKNVEAACDDLDSIEVKPPTSRRPHGRLRGDTNMHAGLMCALRATSKKSRTSARRKRGKKKYGPAAYGPALLVPDGVDTIYLLSDGTPSCDNWNGDDYNDGEVVADAETGERTQHSGSVIYQGPFIWPPYLLPDLTRMNLLQRAAIHTIGLGEADFDLLERISAVGHGKTIRIGKQ